MGVLLSFSSRNQTIRCANILRANGYSSKIGDTPTALHGSCTLSVFTSIDGYNFFSNYLRNFSAFQGAYKIDNGRLSRIS